MCKLQNSHKEPDLTRKLFQRRCGLTLISYLPNQRMNNSKSGQKNCARGELDRQLLELIPLWICAQVGDEKPMCTLNRLGREAQQCSGRRKRAICQKMTHNWNSRVGGRRDTRGEKDCITGGRRVHDAVRWQQDIRLLKTIMRHNRYAHAHQLKLMDEMFCIKGIVHLDERPVMWREEYL